MACPHCKKNKCNCPEPIQGPMGPVGPEGPQGQQGDVPEHEWSGTQLRFRNPDGSWGAWINLQGPEGPCGDGSVGAQGPQGPAGPAGPTGNTGSTGSQGPAGADGVSVVGATIDPNGDLILTMSDGSTINAGNVSSGSGGTGGIGTNNPGYLFKATNNTDQAHVNSSLISFSDDQSTGYYDYGGSWSGVDWAMPFPDPADLIFVLDQIPIKNNGIGNTLAAYQLVIEHIPISTGIPVSIGAISVPAGLAPATTLLVSGQSSAVTFQPGDKVRVKTQTTTDNIVIESGGEFWNYES